MSYIHDYCICKCWLIYIYTRIQASVCHVTGKWASGCVCVCACKYTCVYVCVYVFVFVSVCVYVSRPCLSNGATHCNTLRHTATHCNTLQHTATHKRSTSLCMLIQMSNTSLVSDMSYTNELQDARHVIYTWLATCSRLLKIIGLFCKRALWKRWYSAKET